MSLMPITQNRRTSLPACKPYLGNHYFKFFMLSFAIVSSKIILSANRPACLPALSLSCSSSAYRYDCNDSCSSGSEKREPCRHIAVITCRRNIRNDGERSLRAAILPYHFHFVLSCGKGLKISFLKCNDGRAGLDGVIISVNSLIIYNQP